MPNLSNTLAHWGNNQPLSENAGTSRFGKAERLPVTISSRKVKQVPISLQVIICLNRFFLGQFGVCKPPDTSTSSPGSLPSCSCWADSKEGNPNAQFPFSPETRTRTHHLSGKLCPVSLLRSLMESPDLRRHSTQMACSGMHVLMHKVTGVIRTSGGSPCF